MSQNLSNRKIPHCFKILAVALVICAGCSSKKTITIADESGEVTLKYDCSRFESKVKTNAETHVLLQKTAEIIRRASAEDNNALTRSLRLARQSRDILRLEELIVADECAHQK